jgi:hypothetical protein
MDNVKKPNNSTALCCITFCDVTISYCTVTYCNHSVVFKFRIVFYCILLSYLNFVVLCRIIFCYVSVLCGAVLYSVMFKFHRVMRYISLHSIMFKCLYSIVLCPGIFKFRTALLFSSVTPKFGTVCLHYKF